MDILEVEQKERRVPDEDEQRPEQVQHQSFAAAIPRAAAQ